MPLVEHPLVAKIAFTGSDATGQRIYEAAARGMKRVTMELGGKSPNIVFDDADLDNAVKGAVSGILAATGQTCIAGSRLLVQELIHEPFVEKLVAFARTAKMGDPMSPDTQVGPIANRPQLEKILRLHRHRQGRERPPACSAAGAAPVPSAATAGSSSRRSSPA